MVRDLGATILQPLPHRFKALRYQNSQTRCPAVYLPSPPKRRLRVGRVAANLRVKTGNSSGAVRLLMVILYGAH